MISNQAKQMGAITSQKNTRQIYDEDDQPLDEGKQQTKMHMQMANTTYEGFGGASGNPQ